MAVLWTPIFPALFYKKKATWYLAVGWFKDQQKRGVLQDQTIQLQYQDGTDRHWTMGLQHAVALCSVLAAKDILKRKPDAAVQMLDLCLENQKVAKNHLL